MRGFALALMLISVPSMAVAQGTQACLTAADADALVRYALPDIIGQVGTSCAASLPATAYLIRNQTELAKRYGELAAPALPGARRAFGKIAGLNPKQTENLKDETLRALLGMGINTVVSGKLKPKDCSTVDEILTLLAPVPPENMAKLIGIALREGNKLKTDDTATPSIFRLCAGEKGA